MMNALDRFFRLKELNTDIATEIIAGAVTFMTMAYIIFVNPAILSAAGIPKDALIIATCLAAGLTTLLMGIATNYPFALAPGMGLNAFVTYGVVIGMKLPWQVAMDLVFFEGIVICILVVTRVREWIMNAIPLNIKRAIGVGIGLFIAFIGLQSAGLVVKSDATMVTFGGFGTPALLSSFGLLFTALLMSRHVKGSILIGIVVTGIAASLVGATHLPASVVALPAASHFATLLAPLSPVFLSQALNLGLASVVFALILSDFFDTMGTVVAVGGKAGFLDKSGKLPRLRGVLLVDGIAAMTGGAFGCSSVTTYIESAAGVSEGGRSGLMSIVTGILFFLAILFWPLIAAVPAAATAPALIIVGFLMIGIVREIDWDDITEAFPSFLTILTIPLTFSISRGIGYGFVAYVAIKACTGKWRDVHPAMYVIAAFFIADFILSTLHLA
jgi:adenine/guanine/hypoxanthine permease